MDKVYHWEIVGNGRKYEGTCEGIDACCLSAICIAYRTIMQFGDWELKIWSV